MPVAVTDAKRVSLELAYFSGLGAAIVFVGALVLGRLSVRSLRDIAYAHRPVTATEPEPAVEEIDPAAPPRHALSETEEPETEEPRHHGFGGLFRARGEKSTSAH